MMSSSASTDDNDDVCVFYTKQKYGRKFVGSECSSSDESQCNTVKNSMENMCSIYDKSHHQTLKTGFKQMLQDETLTDVTICVNNRKFRCHRVILSTFSSYFKTMFTSGLNESQSNSIVKLEGIEPQIFQNILNFVYLGEMFDLKITDEIDEMVDLKIADEMLIAADYLQIDTLKECCLEMIKNKINMGNVGYYWQLSIDNFAFKDLNLDCENYFAKYFQDLYKTKMFLQLSSSQLLNLLKNNMLIISHENIVCEAIDKWISHDPGTRQNHVTALFKHVRLSFATDDYLTKFITTMPFMNIEAIKEYVKEAEMFKASSDRQTFLLGKNPRTTIRDCADQEQVLIVIEGSLDGELEQSIRMWSFWPSIKKWRWLANIPKDFCPEDNFGSAACTYGLSTILYSGGYNNHYFYKYDGCENEWTELPSMRYDRAGHCMIVVGKYVYVLGGMAGDRDGDFLARKCFRSIDRFLLNETWGVNNTMNVLKDNKSDYSKISGTVAEEIMWERLPVKENIYNVTSDVSQSSDGDCDELSDSSSDYCGSWKWKLCGKLHYRTTDAKAVVVSEKIYLFGGISADAAIETAIQCFDTSLETCYVVKPNRNIDYMSSRIFGCDDDIFILQQKLKSFTIVPFFQNPDEPKTWTILNENENFTKYLADGFVKIGEHFYLLGGMSDRLSDRFVRFNCSTNTTSIMYENPMPYKQSELCCVTLVLPKYILKR